MKRSLVVLLATSLVLVGCGNDSPSSTDTKSPKTTETKQQKAEQAVLDVYQTYEKTLGQSDEQMRRISHRLNIRVTKNNLNRLPLVRKT